MRVTSFLVNEQKFVVVSHQNISKIVALSKLDGMLDIANRRTFDEFIHNEWKRCARNKTYLSISIIDLDNFKTINDQYGHAVGDYCLEQASNVLKNYSARASDLCARFGGDEFAVAWGNVGRSTSLSLANKILNDIAAVKLAINEQQASKHLTASIGVASIIPEKDKSVDSLLKAADDALYEAKENGKNRVFASA